jgi:hypothetical protein
MEALVLIAWATKERRSENDFASYTAVVVTVHVICQIVIKLGANALLIVAVPVQPLSLYARERHTAVFGEQPGCF